MKHHITDTPDGRMMHAYLLATGYGMLNFLFKSSAGIVGVTLTALDACNLGGPLPPDDAAAKREVLDYVREHEGYFKRTLAEAASKAAAAGRAH